MFKKLLIILTLCSIPVCGYCEGVSQPFELPAFTVSEDHNDIIEARELNDFEKNAYRIKNYVGGGQIVMGSGGLIDAAGDVGLILSCAHLFDGKVGKLEIVSANGDRYAGNLLHYDRALDLSLIAIKIENTTPITPLAMTNPAKGDKIYTAGYGGGSLRTLEATVTGYNKNGKRWDLRANKPLRSGDSGSLVWNKDKRVIGIGWGTSGDGMFVVSLTTIHDFIKEPTVKKECGLFSRFRRQRPGGCGPFGCHPSSPDDGGSTPAPSDPDIIPPPSVDKPPIPKPDPIPNKPLVGPKGDKGDKGEAGKPGKDGVDGKQGPKGDKGEPGSEVNIKPLVDRLTNLENKVNDLSKINNNDLLLKKLEELNAKIDNVQKSQAGDITSLLEKINNLNNKIINLEKPVVIPPKDELLPIQKESKISHFVLVSEVSNSYLNSLITEARKVHPFIKVRDPSELDVIVRGPKLVTYNLEGKEIATDQGINEVVIALQAIAKGQFKR